MMQAALILGLREAAIRWRSTLVMSLAISISLMAFLLLQAYHKDLTSKFDQMHKQLLVVQASGSMGEFYGSRLPASLGRELAAAGASLVVPQIHTIVGTSTENAVLLRGIPLEGYTRVEDFKMLDGRPLQAGDAPRLAMIGARLAETKGVLSGDSIQIRARAFTVAGVFVTETYADYEAWISIEDAQALLGWNDDVSVYVIPSGEALKEGDTLPGGASAVLKGQSGVNLIQEWEPLFNILGLVSTTLGIAAAVALANMLWRLAWLRRRDLAVLQSVGFRKLALAGYLWAQAAGITTFAFAMGLLETVCIGAVSQIKTAGISIHAAIEPEVVGASLIFAILISIASSGLPAWWLARLDLAALLRVEG